MIRDWHAGLSAVPARLRTRKSAKRQNVREIDLANPDAVRRRRATANRIFDVLKAALNLAFRERHAASDEAWRRVKPFREASAPKIRYLDHAEALRLVNACEPGFRPLVQCALLTGCRYGEIVSFRVADFDRDAGTVSVCASKAGRPRHAVLTEDGITLFERHVAGRVGTAPVFNRSDDVLWGRSHQHRPLRDAWRRAGINPPASFHISRHTYATHLLRGSAAAGDRGEPGPLRHAHDRATLCPSSPVTCRSGDPRDDAETRSPRTEPCYVNPTNASDSAQLRGLSGLIPG
jgi:integrase